jgi:flagellar basal-body rod protein FlgG
MQTGYYNAAAGMVAQFNRLDTIANNLANVNTTGFKEDNVVFGDYMRLYQDSRDELPHNNHTKESAKFINRTMARAPQVVDAFTNQSVGNMQKTDNSLDFALSNEGLFFAVKTPNGVRLTRDGSFTTNDEGKLITKQGYEVLSEDYFVSKEGITISEQDAIVNVDKNGKVYINNPNSLNMNEHSALFIVQPDNIRMLKKEGDNLYKMDDIDNIKSIETSGAVKQGFIEKSNVNAVKMMTQMIETNRLVGMYQKAMDTQMNDMNPDAINKLAKRTT